MATVTDTQTRTVRMTEEDYRYLRSEYGGICLACGEEAWETEPDARNYTCEYCGAKQVFGIEELLMMGAVEFTEEED